MPRPLEIKRGGASLEVRRTSTASDSAVVAGYGAVFNNIDSYGDTIIRGAFEASLADWRARGQFPKMLLQHGGLPGGADDEIPIGQWTAMHEDAKGLYVKGSLFALDTDRGRYIYEGLKAGVLDGLSIGFIARDFSYGNRPDEPKRTLKKIDLFEVSIVTWPANSAARVSSFAPSEKAKWAETVRKIEALTASMRAASDHGQRSQLTELADAVRRFESSIRAATLVKRIDTLRSDLQRLKG